MLVSVFTVLWRSSKKHLYNIFRERMQSKPIKVKTAKMLLLSTFLTTNK